MSNAIDKLIEEVLEKKQRSTKVNSWYPHGYEASVRGPFCRWFTCSEVAIQYEKNVAPIADDVEYCSIAMNSAPLLAKALKIALESYDLIKAFDDVDIIQEFVRETESEINALLDKK